MSFLWRLFLEVYGSTPSLSSVSCQAGCFIFWRVFLNVAILSQTEASSQLGILKTLIFLNFSYGTFLGSNSYYRRGRAASLLYEGSFRKAPRHVAVGGVLCFWETVAIFWVSARVSWRFQKKRHPASFSCFGWRGVRISGRTVPSINKLISPTGFGRCFFLTYRKHWLTEPMASWISYPISFFHGSEMDSPSIYKKVGGVFSLWWFFFKLKHLRNW